MNCWKFLVQELRIDISKSPDLEGLDYYFGNLYDFSLSKHLDKVNSRSYPVDSHIDADFCILKSGKHLALGVIQGDYISFLSPDGKPVTQPISKMAFYIREYRKINKNLKIYREP